jgi:LuxR family maltose regulon positive regulatory protein
LSRQPAALQRFLLQTSILDRLCAPLCDAVVGEIEDWRPEVGGRQSPISNLQSQHVLDYLESSNLFIIPLDDERHWYRYHHLFAQVLRAFLRRNVGKEGLARPGTATAVEPVTRRYLGQSSAARSCSHALT